MIILGIDPGIAIVGYGVIEYDGFHMKLIDYGAIYTPAKMWVPERLDILFESMTKLMERFSPDEVAFEELFFFINRKRRCFFLMKRAKTNIVFAFLFK